MKQPITYLLLLVSVRASVASNRIETRSIISRSSRLDNGFVTIYPRSGRSGSQSPPRSRSQSPESSHRPRHPLTALASAAGRGPAVVTPMSDGHVGPALTYQSGRSFELEVTGRRQAAFGVQTSGVIGEADRGTAVVVGLGHQSAKVNVAPQAGSVGRIRRIAPLPNATRWVSPRTRDTQQIFANPPPQKQELMGSLTGQGAVLAEGKSPDIDTQQSRD